MPSIGQIFSRKSALALLLGVSALLVSSCQITPKKGLVVLDIGHHANSLGAKTPAPIDGKTVEELSFWYEYSHYVKEEIEDAGYKCIVINRGDMPKSSSLRRYARRSGVMHQQQTEAESQRYPSRYFADRVARGIISADYAVFSRASCIVFLHHNSTGGRGWSNKKVPGLLLYNKNNGRQLAESMASVMEKELIRSGDFPHHGSKLSLQTRSIDAQAGAGWLNVCDDAGIPAVIIEAAYLNNYQQAAYLADHGDARDYAEAVGDGVAAYMDRRDKKAPVKRKNLDAPDKGSFGYARESRSVNIPGAKRLWH